MKYNIKWTNKFSGETGYVGKMAKSKGHFVNAETVETAKAYASEKMANKDIATLIEIGEAVNNDFEIIVAE